MEKEIVSKDFLEQFAPDNVDTKLRPDTKHWSKDELLMTLVTMRLDFLVIDISQNFQTYLVALALKLYTHFMDMSWIKMVLSYLFTCTSSKHTSKV